jgi:hypothetical protein
VRFLSIKSTVTESFSRARLNFDEWRRGREAGTAYHCVSPDDQRDNRHAAVIRDNEIHYEVAASLDKDFIVIEGATHGITPCVRCEASRQQV